MMSSYQERKCAYVHTPDCTLGPPRNVKYDKVDGCKIDLILLPCDEVGLPAQFSPGDRVMGYIYCLLTKALVCTEFKLKLKGEGSCRFDLYVNPFEDEIAGQSQSECVAGQSWRSKMLSKTFVDSRQMSTHSNREVYVNTSYDVLHEDLPRTAQRNFSSTDKNQLVYVLEPGEYRFPFSLQLPPKIPPSLIADEAKITYTLSVILSLPHFQSVFKVISRPIPVICKTFVPGPSPNTSTPSRSKKGKTSSNNGNNRSTMGAPAALSLPGGGAPFCEGGEVLEETVIGCCMPDHLDLSVCWDKEKYAPGECLLVTSNLTTTAPKEVAVHGGYVNLIQVATFTAKDGEVKVKEASVAKRDFICHPLLKFPLPLPLNLPPSSPPSPFLQQCSFISLRYIVRFKLYTEFTTMETKWNVGVGPMVIYHTLASPPAPTALAFAHPPNQTSECWSPPTTTATHGEKNPTESRHRKHRHSRHLMKEGLSTDMETAPHCLDPTSKVTGSIAGGQLPNTEPSAPPMQSCDDVSRISNDVTPHIEVRRGQKESNEVNSCSRRRTSHVTPENNQNDLNSISRTENDFDNLQEKPPPYEEVILLDSIQRQVASEMTSLTTQHMTSSGMTSLPTQHMTSSGMTSLHMTSSQNGHLSEEDEEEQVAFEQTPFYLSYQENDTILRS